MLNSISSFLFGPSGEEPTTETATATTTTTTTTTTSPQGDGHCRLKETPTEEEWILIDRSRGNSPHHMEASPLENLLIEHPSMSVYQHRLRQNSAGLDSDISEASETCESSEMEPAASHKRRHGGNGLPGMRISNRQPRMMAARTASLCTVQQTVKATELASRRSKRRLLSSTQLARGNLIGNRSRRQRNKSFVMQPTARSAGKRC